MTRPVTDPVTGHGRTCGIPGGLLVVAVAGYVGGDEDQGSSGNRRLSKPIWLSLGQALIGVSRSWASLRRQRWVRDEISC